MQCASIVSHNVGSNVPHENGLIFFSSETRPHIQSFAHAKLDLITLISDMSVANEGNWSGSSRASARKTRFQARVDKLAQTFLDLKHDMELRRYMLTLVRDQGLHCRACSSLRNAGACGPTCPLLRPRDSAESLYHGVSICASETWCRDSVDVLRRYKTITDSLKRHKYNVSVLELAEWEREAQNMHWEEVGELEDRHLGRPFDIMVDFAEIDWQKAGTLEQWHAHGPLSR